MSGQSSAHTAKKQCVGGSARVARQPNGVTRSRCGSSESLLRKSVSNGDQNEMCVNKRTEYL